MAAHRKAPQRAVTAHMHVCPSCKSELVQPAEWWEVGGSRWHVELRCPECDWHGAGDFAQAIVDRYDEVLDSGTQRLITELRELTRANMEEEAARFAKALADDSILPEDF